MHFDAKKYNRVRALIALIWVIAVLDVIFGAWLVMNEYFAPIESLFAAIFVFAVCLWAYNETRNQRTKLETTRKLLADFHYALGLEFWNVEDPFEDYSPAYIVLMVSGGTFRLSQSGPDGYHVVIDLNGERKVIFVQKQVIVSHDNPPSDFADQDVKDWIEMLDSSVVIEPVLVR